MENICEYNKCTGCSSCVSSCPRHCITLKEDKFGETHPVINQNLCIDCHRCIKSCPNNVDLIFNKPRMCYASWLNNKEKRKICASGGIGTILSEYVIKIKKGVVFGTSYDDNLQAHTTYCESLDGLESFKGSKYVQSFIAPQVFQQVKSFLNNGRFVLYIGTPCQIAGLKSYLNREYDNLLTVDLICHGVSPTCYLNEEVDFLCKKYGINKSKINNIRFRGNDSTRVPKWKKILGEGESNNFAFTLWSTFNNEPKRCFWQSKTLNYYLAGFLQGITLRENCYTCNYARPERVSDITIGDFIGLGTHIPFPNINKKHKSVVLLNTEKAEIFYKNVMAHSIDLCNVKRDYKERLEYAPSLLHPFKRHPLNDKFRKLYVGKGFIYASRKAMGNEVTRQYREERLHYYMSLVKRIFGIKQ